MVDLYFYYKYVGRNLLLNKITSYQINSYKMPCLLKVVVYFSIKEVQDLDDLRSLNCAYLCRFFFGRKLYMTNYKSRFDRSIYYYSYDLSLVTEEKDMYYIVFFYLNDIKAVVSSNFIKVCFEKEGYLNIIVTDLDIFVEKKDNIGLFNLKDDFNLKLFYDPINFGEQIINILKI